MAHNVQESGHLTIPQHALRAGLRITAMLDRKAGLLHMKFVARGSGPKAIAKTAP
jgi:hypothetical protein